MRQSGPRRHQSWFPASTWLFRDVLKGSALGHWFVDVPWHRTGCENSRNVSRTEAQSPSVGGAALPPEAPGSLAPRLRSSWGLQASLGLRPHPASLPLPSHGLCSVSALLLFLIGFRATLI